MVVNSVKSFNANYKVYTEKLTDIEVARLRNATDIMIQLSTTDGRSASIIESFLAGAILITGKWLPYAVFRKKHLYFFELDRVDSSLPELIIQLYSNIDDVLMKCRDNRNKWEHEPWDKEIKSWIAIYDKLSVEK